MRHLGVKGGDNSSLGPLGAQLARTVEKPSKNKRFPEPQGGFGGPEVTSAALKVTSGPSK